MTLSEYLSVEQILQAAFADRIGVKQATVSRLARGEMRPSLDLALRIEAETKRKVPVAVWAEHPPQHVADAPEPRGVVLNETGEACN